VTVTKPRFSLLITKWQKNLQTIKLLGLLGVALFQKEEGGAIFLGIISYSWVGYDFEIQSRK